MNMIFGLDVSKSTILSLIIFIGLLILFLLIGIILLIYPLHFLLGQPLQRLSKTFLLIQSGNLKSRLIGLKQDELGDVGHDFNKMANWIQRSFADLIEVNAHVSHELRSPITRMQLIIELFKKDIFGISEIELKDKTNFFKQMQHRFDELVEEIDRLDALVGSVSNLSKIGSVDGCKVSVNISNLVVSILDKKMDQLKDKKIILIRNIEQAIIREIDLRSAELIIRNLLDNAIFYSLQTMDTIAVDLYTKEGAVYFVIENDMMEGNLTNSDVEQWFLPFFRASDSASLNAGGVGLGLTLSKTAAQKIGGDLFVSVTSHRVQFKWVIY